MQARPVSAREVRGDPHCLPSSGPAPNIPPGTGEGTCLSVCPAVHPAFQRSFPHSFTRSGHFGGPETRALWLCLLLCLY